MSSSVFLWGEKCSSFTFVLSVGILWNTLGKGFEQAICCPLPIVSETLITFGSGLSVYWPAILCIFMRLAWMRPFASLCFAMMQRMWSAKIKLACRMGRGLACGLELGLWMTIFSALLSSSTPDTCMSCLEIGGEGEERSSNSFFFFIFVGIEQDGHTDKCKETGEVVAVKTWKKKKPD